MPPCSASVSNEVTVGSEITLTTVVGVPVVPDTTSYELKQAASPSYGSHSSSVTSSGPAVTWRSPRSRVSLSRAVRTGDELTTRPRSEERRVGQEGDDGRRARGDE